VTASTLSSLRHFVGGYFCASGSCSTDQVGPDSLALMVKGSAVAPNNRHLRHFFSSPIVEFRGGVTRHR
jgi:hypothetical protein